MRVFLSLTIFLLTITSCFSQQNLMEGYVIELSNDTIYGYIDFRGDIYNSSKCVFFDQPGSESRIFYPGEIVAYRFPGSRYYISKSIKTISGDSTVFLEYLVNGITSLYYLKDNIGDHFFIERGNELYELTDRKSVV